jgi:hypothetical protein
MLWPVRAAPALRGSACMRMPYWVICRRKLSPRVLVRTERRTRRMQVHCEDLGAEGLTTNQFIAIKRQLHEQLGFVSGRRVRA